jgi:hypothetical protein
MKKTILILSILIGICGVSFAQSGEDLPYATRGKPLLCATAPVNGTSEIQSITWTGYTGGVTKLTYAGQSRNVTLSSTNSTAQISAAVLASLGSIPTISGTGNVSVSTGGSTNIVSSVTFTGNLAKLNVPQLAATVVSGSNTVATATTTPGVTADGRKAMTGQLLIAADTGILYSNSSTTTLNPTWIKVSAQ